MLVALLLRSTHTYPKSSLRATHFHKIFILAFFVVKKKTLSEFTMKWLLQPILSVIFLLLLFGTSAPVSAAAGSRRSLACCMMWRVVGKSNTSVAGMGTPSNSSKPRLNAVAARLSTPASISGASSPGGDALPTASATSAGMRSRVCLTRA